MNPGWLLTRVRSIAIDSNVVVADTKALATSATTHIFSSCKLTIPTSIIFLQIYAIFSILSVK